MKHISSRGPYLSSRKVAGFASLLSPYKSCSSLHLWNDALIFILVFSLAWSNSLFLNSFSSSVFLFLLFFLGNDAEFFSTLPAQRGSAKYALRVRGGLPAGNALLDTVLGLHWLYLARSSGFLQIKLHPLGGPTAWGFLHSWPVSYSTVRS